MATTDKIAEIDKQSWIEECMFNITKFINYFLEINMNSKLFISPTFALVAALSTPAHALLGIGPDLFEFSASFSNKFGIGVYLGDITDPNNCIFLYRDGLVTRTNDGLNGSVTMNDGTSRKLVYVGNKVTVTNGFRAKDNFKDASSFRDRLTRAYDYCQALRLE